jgi:hypothetical protein
VKLFAKGNRVSQANYGSGTITSSDERYTVIEFDNHGRRVFITDMVALSQSDEPAPKKKAAARKKKAVPVAAAAESE